MKSIVYNGPLFLMAISTGTAAWLFIEKWIIDQEFFSNEIVYWIGLISGAPGVAAGVWLWDELRKSIYHSPRICLYLFLQCFVRLVYSLHIALESGHTEMKTTIYGWILL